MLDEKNTDNVRNNQKKAKKGDVKSDAIRALKTTKQVNKILNDIEKEVKINHEMLSGHSPQSQTSRKSAYSRK